MHPRGIVSGFSPSLARRGQDSASVRIGARNSGRLALYVLSSLVYKLEGCGKGKILHSTYILLNLGDY